ncbi:MAG: FRG domain-containing protein [Arthrobacter sp.]|jgi:hypothetical protein|nr:FRG domain-containing protein [Arthrobacter sp.]
MRSTPREPRRRQPTAEDWARLERLSPEFAHALRERLESAADGGDVPDGAWPGSEALAELVSRRRGGPGGRDGAKASAAARELLATMSKSRPELYRSLPAEEPHAVGQEGPPPTQPSATPPTPPTPGTPTPPREAGADVERFFAATEARVETVEEYIDAVATLQRLHWRAGLVWRGHGNAAWSVRSSLSRVLAESGAAHEAELVEAELTTRDAASDWDPHNTPTIGLLAELQHAGAPTRLLDVSTDPDVSAWFAVENPADDDADARLLVWGGTSADGEVEDADDLDYLGTWFWHEWQTRDKRIEAGWGTGVKTWWWLPPTTNERLRAQRGGFLLEAEPIVSEEIAAVFAQRLGSTWTPAQIAAVTSVLGMPARHDEPVVPNEANLVPLFSLRLARELKPELRRYLGSKGLTDRYIYPDQAGLVRHLQRSLRD